MAPFLWLQVGIVHWQAAPIPLPAKPTKISKLPKLTQVTIISCLVNTAAHSGVFSYILSNSHYFRTPPFLSFHMPTHSQLPPILTPPPHTPVLPHCFLTLESGKCPLPDFLFNSGF